MALLDPEKVKDLPTPVPTAPTFDFGAARDRGTDLEAIEVSEELAGLYSDARQLLDVVLNDAQTPANQKAQVLNSVHSLIERIMKNRTDLHNAERIRTIEHIVIRVMNEQPQEVKEEFVRQYQAALGALD